MKKIGIKILSYFKDFWLLILSLSILTVTYLINKCDKSANWKVFIILCISVIFVFYSVPFGVDRLAVRKSQLTKSSRLGNMTVCFIIATIPSFMLAINALIYIYNNVKKDKDTKLLFLNIQLLVSFVIMIILLIAYFSFCVSMLKKELNCKYTLFISYSIKSLLIALASSFAILAALSYLKSRGINEIFQIIFKNICIVVAMLYPFFDMFEYTYKEINEYEKKNENMKKKKNKKANIELQLKINLGILASEFIYEEMNNREEFSLLCRIINRMKEKNTMSNVREYIKSKGNLTIKTKIDFRPKTVIKTAVIFVVIVIAIVGAIKWL